MKKKEEKKQAQIVGNTAGPKQHVSASRVFWDTQMFSTVRFKKAAVTCHIPFS